jgi:acyl transferase domain-containing protein
VTDPTAPDVESVAVIGMAGRFPKARNLNEFWQNLESGVECISFFEGDEAVDVGANHSHHVGAGGVLEDLDRFDAQFFGFSARDAEGTDPQQRVFLECAWEGLEDAGYVPEHYPGLIGVFAGAALSSYMADIYADPNVYARYDDMQIGIGNDKDHLTTQLSYKLNLRGPSVTVQTACSTSLVAVCFACQSLLNYECDIALAGGVAAHLGTQEGYYYQPGGILSPDGHCRPFDAQANGTVGGNGVGIVILKRLSEAVRDGDNIRAVIRGFALNNDGSRKVGYTAPSVSGQSEVISMAQALAGVDPESISYIETHGTGTALGDPIEVAALHEVFGRSRSQTGTCALGSVKGNIGHLDTAAGVAGLIKTVLSLEHGLIPPSLNFTRLNPSIDLTNSGFYVNSELRPWRSEGGPRIAGVSSFGIGGTNAHVVLEEAPDGPGPPPDRRHSDSGSRPLALLAISARSPAALERATDNLVAHLEAEKPDHLTDVAFTLGVGRKSFAHRRSLVWPAHDVSGAFTALGERDSQQLLTGKATQGRSLYFMFPGQGAQHLGMGAELYATERRFREEMDRCSEMFRVRLGVDLRELLYPAEGRSEATLRQTQYAQAALFAVEYALAHLWLGWGLIPNGMIGHSIGEYVAACLAGVFGLDDAIDLVALRGEVMAAMPTGGMLAVPLGEDSLDRYVGLGLSIAAINAPMASVLSGADDALDQVEAELRHDGVSCVRLRVSHAFHSQMMEPAARQLVEHVRQVPLHPPEMPYVSNVTGSWVTPELVTDPEYWGRHLRMPVRFADGLASLHGGEPCVLLEVGPGVTLAGLVRQQSTPAPEQLTLSSLGPPGASDADSASVLRTLGRLWIAGVEGDPMSFHDIEARRRVSLPTYPFERQRYVVEVPEEQAYDDAGEEAEGYGGDLTGWFYQQIWQLGHPDATADRPPSHAAAGWLIFDDGGAIGLGIAERLRAHGRVVTVRSGAEFAHAATNDYTIDGSQPGHCDRLVQALEADGGCPDVLIHLWGLSGGASDDHHEDDHGAAGLLGINQLAQSVHRARATRDPFVLNVVTNQVHSVTGREHLSPQKASVLGACRVLPQELPRLTTRAIDLDDDCYEPTRIPLVIDALVAEVMLEPLDPVVALRRGYRWVQAFEPSWLGEDVEPTRRLRQGGTYLITGGLGKVGMVLASHLARTRHANLVLTGRSPLPSSDSPTEAAGAEHNASAMLDQIAELRALGAEVVYIAADVADGEAMIGVVGDAEQRFGRIDGVIHAAGLTEGHVAGIDATEATANAQLGPKASGLKALGRALEGRQPDFLLTMSSLSTVLGGLGLMDYAAANCVMDAMCTDHNREGGTPWISVDWDAWDFAASESDAQAAGILPWQGEALFERIIDRAPSHVVVCVGDLHARFDDWVRLGAHTEIPSQGDLDEEFYDRPELLNAYVPATSPTESELAEMWQLLLGVAPVGITDNFFELGGHSLLAIQVISRIAERFEVDLSVARVFEMPTIAALAPIIEEGQSASLSSQRAEELLDIVEELSASDLERLLDATESLNESALPDD